MENVANKIDGSSTLPAAEFNSHKNELQNLVTESGQTLALATPDQLRKAVSVYSRSLIMEDSSVTPNVLTLARPNGLTDVPIYYDGMTILFSTPNANTGATTVTVNGLASKKVRTYGDTDLTGKEILSNVIYTLTYDSSFDAALGAFILKPSYTKLGTTTNDNASVGQIGEYISSSIASGSALALTTAIALNITSISLTAGDWDVEGFVGYVGQATIGMLFADINTISSAKTVNAISVPGFGSVFNGATYGGWLIPTTQKRISIAATTTVYLIAYANFSAGTGFSAYGTISARRVR